MLSSFVQVLVELHTQWLSQEAKPQVLEHFFRGMFAAGYRVFSIETNYDYPDFCIEYGFVRANRDGYMSIPP